jgi:hypothetical protein
MWSNWAESAKSSVTRALDKTGDVISKVATNAGKATRERNSKNEVGHTTDSIVGDSNSNTHTNQYYVPTIVELPPDPKKPVHHVDETQVQGTQEQQQSAASSSNENQLLSSISQGWFNVLDATVATFKHAEGAIKEQRMIFEQTISKAVNNNFPERDVSLPLDVEALQDAEVVYITDRIITMGHPTCK